MVYYVEDDTNIRDLVVYTLNNSGVPAQGFPDSAAFYAALAEAVPDLVLLDIMLPGEDGLSVLKKLRGDRRHYIASLPVIMVTAKSAEFDTLLGLDSGADDYIVKPFSIMEVLSRVKAMLRRAERFSAASGTGAAVPVLAAGALTVDLKKHAAYLAGTELMLTLKEFELLEMLLGNDGTVFSREHLLETVWGYAYGGETRTVDVHIGQLRQKLGAYASCIETVRGVGYRFNSEKAET